MTTDVIMPVLGMAQDSGVLVRWLKQPGQSVARGEILFEVETDKAVQEIEAQASGILGPWLAREGEVVPVTQVVAQLYAPGELLPAALAPGPLSAATLPKAAAVAATPLAARMAAAHDIDLAKVQTESGKVQKADVLAYLAATEQRPAGRILASPKARRLAGERHLDLAGLQGSGPGGAVLAADVLAWRPPVVEKPVPVAQEVRPPGAVGKADDMPMIPTSHTWQRMAERTTQAWISTPQFYLQRRALAPRLVEWLHGARSRSTQKVTVSDLLVMACARCLALHPQVNRSWQDGRLVAFSSINVGLAVALEDGLVVPVIHHADRLSLHEIAHARAELAARAREGRLRSGDVTDGTITISNLGMFGVDRFLAILNPPQAAILAAGAIRDEVVPLNGQPAVQPVIDLTVTFDHRVVDGAIAARFLQTLAAIVEEPLRLLEQAPPLPH
ncbi:MAG: dihydrolipoamide acetyltransferase family protein [Caldilineaceae bacterium]